MRDDNSALILVLPYTKSGMAYTEQSFDSIIVPNELYKVYPKAAITKRNEWLIENANLLIAYVIRNEGGAAKTLTYGIKRGIAVLNLAEEEATTLFCS
ncbi:MAG: hypothetical protein J6K61_05755 [Clostridia bacterium]|nr:hypothetical protein [Clostridia bacterium]